MDRTLSWDGCANVRDLGGIPTMSGRVTAWGSVVRSDHPNNLSARGWAALEAYGVTTILTLVTDGVDLADQLLASCPSAIEQAVVAIEDARDPEFTARWVETGLWGTPLYWSDAVNRWPHRHAEAVAAVANASAGTVLVHCGRGQDRTGLVTALMLALLDVDSERIAEDYQLSARRHAPEERDAFAAAMARHGGTVGDAVRRFRDSIEGCLRLGGLTDADLAALRSRLLVPG